MLSNNKKLLLGIAVFIAIKFEFTFANISPNYDELKGVQLKFVSGHFPPFDVFTLKPDGNITHTGICPLLYDWLSERLNFTISYMIIDDKIAAKYGSTIDMMVYLLQEKKVDAATMGFIATPERKQIMDFAYFMWTEPYVMVVPRPGEEPRLFAFIRPFQPNVWLLILATMILMTGSMTLFIKAYSSNVLNLSNQKKVTWLESAKINFLDVLKTITNQGGSHYKGHIPFRILVGVWLLVATVFVNCYSSTVISYLTLPRNKPQINSFEDLAANSEVEVLIRSDFLIGQEILEAKNGALKILGDQVRRNPNRLLYKTSEFLKLLQTGRFAFPFLKSACVTFVGNRFKEERKCRFTTTDPLTMYRYWAVTLNKDSKCTRIFNDALMELWETGLPWFWAEINIPQAPQCFVKVKSSTDSAHQVAIHLTDLLGAFLILGAGIGLSIFSFILEHVYTKRSC